MRAADYEAKAAEAAEGAFLYLLCQPLGGQLFALDAEGEYRFAGLDAGEDPLALLRESGGYLSGIRLLGRRAGVSSVILRRQNAPSLFSYSAQAMRR